MTASSEKPVNRKAERCPRCKYPYHGLPADRACPECGMQVRTGALVFYGPRRPFAVLDVLYLFLAGWSALAVAGSILRQDMIFVPCNAVAALLVAVLWRNSRRRRYCYVVVDGDRVLYGCGGDAYRVGLARGMARRVLRPGKRGVSARCARAHHRNGALPLRQWSHRPPDL